MKPSFYDKAFKKKYGTAPDQIDTTTRAKTTITDTPTFYDWNLKYRKMVEGHRNFVHLMPHWAAIYKDEHYYIQLKLARQTGKTTYNMGFLGYMGTTTPRSVTNYITKDDISLTAMSGRKYRYGVLKSNKAINDLVKGKTELHKVDFLNNAMTNLGTHAHGFSQFVGKSADATLMDEGQDLEWGSWANLNETQAFTQGTIKITGIGGYLESDYNIRWKETDQREWVFDNSNDYRDTSGKLWVNQGWRSNLEFKEDRPLISGEFTLPQSSLIFGDYLLKAMAGHWQPKYEDADKHGYHMTQYMMPNLALTVSDAKKLYHSNPDFAIEKKWNEYTPAERSMYILAEDTEGASKPFTTEAIKRLFIPGKHFTLPADVDPRLGTVVAGIDWGAGRTAFTIVTIAQIIDIDAPVFDILYIAKLPPMGTDEEIALKAIEIIESYSPHPIIMDGWGIPHCVQRIEGMYGTRCRKVRYTKRPQLPIPTRQEHKILRKKNLFEIDRSWAIEKIKNIIDEHKIDETTGSMGTPRIRLPGEENIQFVIDHLIAVEGEETKINGKSYMDYDHPTGRPDDTLHSLIGILVALLLLTKFGGGGRRGVTSVDMDYYADAPINDDGYFTETVPLRRRAQIF